MKKKMLKICFALSLMLGVLFGVSNLVVQNLDADQKTVWRTHYELPGGDLYCALPENDCPLVIGIIQPKN